MNAPIATGRWACLTAVALVAVAGCGSSTPVASNTAPGVTVSGPGGSATLPAPEIKTVKLGLLQATTGHDSEVAIEDGLFTKYGLNVTIQTFTSQGSEVTALLAGQVDMAGDIGVAEVMGSQSTDSPLEVVMEEKGNLSDNLYTSKDVKTAADLKGKSIAISSFGSVTYGEALIAVKSLGLTTSDVTITQVGNDAARRAALVAGSVQGSLDDESERAALTAQGFNVLVPLSQLTYGLPVGDLVVTKSYAQTNPNTVLAVVASLVQGLHVFLTNPSDAIQAAIKYEHIDVPTATSNVQVDLKGWRPVDGRPITADFQAAQALYEKLDPQITTLDVTTTFTTKFENQLKSLGWYKALGIPTS